MSLNKVFVGDKARVEGLVTAIDLEGIHVTLKPTYSSIKVEVVEAKLKYGSYITVLEEQREYMAKHNAEAITHPIDAIVCVIEQSVQTMTVKTSDGKSWLSLYSRRYRLATKEEINKFVASETELQENKIFDELLKKVGSLSFKQTLTLVTAANERLGKIAGCANDGGAPKN